MESCSGQQRSPVQILQLPCPPMTALVLLFHLRLVVLVREKNLPASMLHSLVVILFLGT